MLLALQLCGLLGSKNMTGATNLIDTACQAATRYFCSLLTLDLERVHIPYPVTHHLSHTVSVGQSVCSSTDGQGTTQQIRVSYVFTRGKVYGSHCGAFFQIFRLFCFKGAPLL